MKRRNPLQESVIIEQPVLIGPLFFT